MSREAFEERTMIQTSEINKEYGGTEVLYDVSVGIEDEQLTLFTGPSGSGKTTLLNILAGLTRPTTGDVWYRGQSTRELDDEELTSWRAYNIGTVFQRSGLLGGLNAEQNILTPHRLVQNEIDKDWLRYLTDKLSIDHVMQQKSSRLSGGEKQRVSIARALAHRPDVLFADEPTASLDLEAKRGVHNIFRSLVDEAGVAVVMVSHEDISKGYADRIVYLQEGRIKQDS